MFDHLYVSQLLAGSPTVAGLSYEQLRTANIKAKKQTKPPTKNRLRSEGGEGEKKVIPRKIIKMLC